MAQFEFKCPQCGHAVMADDKMRGTVAECPHCEKGIVVPQAQGAVQQGSHVRLHPVRRDFPQADPPQEPQFPQQKPQLSEQESMRVTEFDRMAEQEADRRKKERAHEILMLLLKIAAVIIAVIIIVTVGCSMWKDYKTINVTEQKEALVKELQSAREELEAQRQRMAEMERRADHAERKVNEMKVPENESARVNERDLQEADRTIKELREKLEASSAAYEQKIAELKARHQRELEAAARAAEGRAAAENMRGTMSSRFNSSSTGTHEQSPGSVQGNSTGEPISHDGSSDESVEELRRKIDENLAEIKKLRTENLSCHINPKDPACPNISQKIATAKDTRYSTSVKVTYVRDAFYCSRCRRMTAYRGRDVADYGYGYCDVCRQQSFNMWLKYRKNVEKTAEINKRIDEINSENALLEKKIRKIR